MLAIRMQRTGRKGHAMFRVIVQDARRTPTSGKIVARLGNFDPHSKAVALDKEKATFYLEHGAQPSPRAARLLKAEGVKLPAWVQEPADKKREVRDAAKRRSTRPDEPQENEQAPVEETLAEAAPATENEAPAETAEGSDSEEPAEEQPKTEDEKPPKEA